MEKNIEKAEILEYKFDNGVLMWPLIRYKFFSKSIQNKNQKIRKRNNKLELIIKFLYGILNFKIAKKKIQIYSSTLFNFKDGEKYINILDDAYYNCFKNDTLIYEKRDADNNWRFPRKNKDVSTALDFLEIVISVLNKVKNIFVKKEDLNIKKMIDYLEKNGVNKEKIKEIEIELVDIRKKIDIYIYIYKKFLKITNPKIIFVNCAWYGGFNSVLIKIANEAKIITAEMQHGTVSKEHIAYNHTKEILENREYCSYFPEYFLDFGKYWENEISISSKKVLVGYDYLNKISKKVVNEKKYDYLFISQWTVTQELIDLACDIVDIKMNRIGFRLHPAEQLTEKQKKQLETKGIEVIHPDNTVYEDILFSKNIVGCYSTVLFEATVFDANIYILKNAYSDKYIPENLGVKIRSASEIIDSNFFKDENNEIENIYFEEKFEERYKEFISNIL